MPKKGVKGKKVNKNDNVSVVENYVNGPDEMADNESTMAVMGKEDEPERGGFFSFFRRNRRHRENAGIEGGNQGEGNIINIAQRPEGNRGAGPRGGGQQQGNQAEEDPWKESEKPEDIMVDVPNNDSFLLGYEKPSDESVMMKPVFETHTFVHERAVDEETVPTATSA